MLSLNRFDHIYIYRPFVDFRKGINGLTLFIQEELQLDPFEKYLFIFCNRGKNRIKALYWDQTGFALWYKCLEKERYKWPFHLNDDLLIVDVEKFNDFLTGLNPWQVPHKKNLFSSV